MTTSSTVLRLDARRARAPRGCRPPRARSASTSLSAPPKRPIAVRTPPTRTTGSPFPDMGSMLHGGLGRQPHVEHARHVGERDEPDEPPAGDDEGRCRRRRRRSRRPRPRRSRPHGARSPGRAAPSARRTRTVSHASRGVSATRSRGSEPDGQALPDDGVGAVVAERDHLVRELAERHVRAGGERLPRHHVADAQLPERVTDREVAQLGRRGRDEEPADEGEPSASVLARGR